MCRYITMNDSSVGFLFGASLPECTQRAQGKLLISERAWSSRHPGVRPGRHLDMAPPDSEFPNIA